MIGRLIVRCFIVSGSKIGAKGPVGDKLDAEPFGTEAPENQFSFQME